MVAVLLVVNFHPPSLVLTDLLNFMQLIRSWDQRPAAKILSIWPHYRHRLGRNQRWRCSPTLEKVKAHDEGGCNSGNLKALGNEQVDGLAKQAADGVDAVPSLV